MLRRHSLLPLWVLLVVAALAADCKPAVGRPCTRGQAACTDARSGLFCAPDGTYRAVPCRGRDGCRPEGAKVSCDQSIAVEGDACTEPGFACTEDKKTDLTCRDGVFVRAQTCAGPFGCRVAPYDGFAPGGLGAVRCDNDVARAGDPCLDDGDFGCAPDELEALKCVAKTMVPFRTCDGPGGCRVVHRTSKESDLDCDALSDGGT
jgi:hypothetical protein